MAPGTAAGTDLPFGLPVLAEVPQLAALLEDLRKVDRLLAQAIDTLLLLEDTGLVELTTGMAVNTWLSIVGRRTGADIRMLRTTASIMRRVPTLHGAFQAGTISWAQVRAVVLAVRPLPGHLDDRIDEAVAYVVTGSPDAEPDALTRSIRWHLDALEPTEVERDERQAEAAEYLAMQPRLDGTGGKFWGELGPTNWAILDAAVNVGASPPSDDGTPGEGTGPAGPHGHPIRAAGHARAQRLIGRLESGMAGAQGVTTGARGETGPARTRTQLLLRADLDTLLDRDQTPASLLTTLLGGHVRVSATTARRLVEERGADLRTVILDDHSAVVGVGRRTRLAPGWLSDATLIRHDTCDAPACNRAARASQTDHAVPWHRARPGAPLGRTDVDQLAPLCDHHNGVKERDGWTVTQRPDGSRRWQHPRTGLTTETLPLPHRRQSAFLEPD